MDETINVFPAQAGVIPDEEQKAVESESIPRASGGDPHAGTL